MTTTLCLTIRFIQPFPLFHGTGEAGIPEWPPSPMRAFQSLLNAAASHSRGNQLDANMHSALSTLEAIHPEIIAPPAQPSKVGYRTYVPHNQADLVSAAWRRGNLEASVAAHRTEKDVRPMLIAQDEDSLPAIHYLYSLNLASEASKHLLNIIRPAARSITALGWGIDQVIGDARLIAPQDWISLKGQSWKASEAGRRLRVPHRGSLDGLLSRHQRFLNRLVNGRFDPVPPLSAMDIIGYRRDNDPVARPHVVFKLLDENDDAFRYPHAKLIHVAGMTRHLAIDAMRQNPPPFVQDSAEWINRVVRGKPNPNAADAHKQFSYIPLPSIGHAHSDALIRNVMIVAPLGMQRELNYLAERLDGRMLEPEDDELCRSNLPLAMSQSVELQRFNPPRGKFIAESYLGTSTTWHTVTPVILDGHNKKSKNDKPEAIARETQKLICKALQRAGVETPCEFEWQSVPYLENCLSAHKYDHEGRHTGYYRPDHLKDFTAVHVRLKFTDPVPGPLAIGAGRHCGFGLMAAVDE